MSDSKIQTNIQGAVATVCLNNPAKMNAFDDAIIESMTTAFNKIDSDPNIRVMVLRANGKHFSAGGDLAWMKRMASYSHQENLQDARKLAEMLKTLNGMSIPTIARVQGAAFGGAVGLVSCCDIAVASPAASFSLSEVKIGLLPATISPYVIDAIGKRAARRLFLTAERFSAEVALQLGLVSSICPEADLDAEVMQIVTALLQNSPAAITAAKQLVSDVGNRAINAELIDDTCERIASIRASSEGQEGLNAFLQKRKPAWISSAE